MKTKDLILEVLKKHGELESGAISKLINLTYDTTSKHLKQMIEKGTLNRKAKGKPWNYYYTINKIIENETKI